MNFVGFKLVEITNPTTAEVTQKLRVVGDNGLEYNFLTDLTVEQVKEKRNELLKNITLGEGPYGKFAMVRKSKVVEEF